MKIALVIELMDPARGGRETYAAQLAAGLARREHEVTVVCQGANWTSPPVVICPLGRRGLLRTSRMRHFVQAARSAVRDGTYDVVHALLALPAADIYHAQGGAYPAWLAANRRHRPLVGRWWNRLTARANRFRCFLGRLERQVVADPNVICLAPSEMVADHLRDSYGRSDGVRGVFSGVEVPDRDDERRAAWRQRIRFQLGVGPEDPVFLTIARNFPLKGVAETIAAFAKWHHSRGEQMNPRLVIVGRELVSGYRRMASLRDVRDLVLFVPPTRDIFQWYAAADAVVLLTWYDPCSLVVLEAARWGIPSLTTAYNGAAKVLADGAAIVVDSPKDTAGVLAGLDELADPDRRAALARRVRRVADHFSMDRHIDRLLDVYREVTRRR